MKEARQEEDNGRGEAEESAGAKKTKPSNMDVGLASKWRISFQREEAEWRAEVPARPLRGWGSVPLSGNAAHVQRL